MHSNSSRPAVNRHSRRMPAHKSIFAFGILAALALAFVIAPLATGSVSAQETRATAIDRVEPRNIPANTGGTLSVYGSGFTADSVIRLRGYGLLVTTFVNSGALTGQIPTTIPAGSYTVEVRDPSGNSEWDRQINIVAPPPPTNEPQQPIPTQEPLPTQEPAPIPSPPPGEPRLTARGYTVTPQTIKPGDPLAITFELVNLGNRTAQSIIASLDPAGKFLPSGGIASLTVPDINPGGTFLVSLSAIGALDLPAGPAVIPIKLTYRDFQGETFESAVSFSVNVEAVSVSTQLTVSEYITEPDPVIPGSPVLVQIVVTNSGTVAAPQALLRISGADSVLLAGPQGDSFPLGDLAPGDSMSVNAELVVRADATAGPQAQPYTLSYMQGTELKEFTGTLTLNVAQVQAPEPLLLLEEYELSEADLKPGDRFTLTATVANVGTGPVNNLLATFGSVTDDSSGGSDGGSGSGGTTTTPSTTFAPLGTGGSIFVGTLRPEGDSATLEQSFIVSGSARSGVYTLPITLRYPNAKREIVTTSLSISVIVVAPPELQFVDAPLPPEAFIGEPQTISIAFTNIGARDVAFRSAEVVAENAEVMDGAEVFIGTVKAGEEGSTMATVMPSGEGPVKVTVNLHYIDELNQPRTIVRTYETVAVEMPPMPTEDPSMFPPEETPVPEAEPEPTFAEILGKGLLGLLGLGS